MVKSSRPRGSLIETSENSDRWLISYADLITLLFAFFVVMYSTASINEGKMRVLSDSLVASFTGRNKTLAPIQVGKLSRSPYVDEEAPATTAEELVLIPARAGPEEKPETGEKETPSRTGTVAPDEVYKDEVHKIADEVAESLRQLINIDAVTIREHATWIEIDISSVYLFVSGSARLSDLSIPILQRLANVLKSYKNPVQVEGFTDNRPINTAVYPSNWELSAARAASVVHLFAKSGIEPGRMVAIGYGEHRPVADNATESGRSRNRRVVIVIPANEDVRRALEAERRATVRRSLLGNRRARFDSDGADLAH